MGKKKQSVKQKMIARQVANAVLSDQAPQSLVNGLTEALLGVQLGSFGTQISQVDTIQKNLRNYLITHHRQLLSEVYAERGLVRTLVDVPVEDAFRGGYEITSKQLDPDQIEELMQVIDRQSLNSEVFARGMKWNRLFGGAGIVILTDQDPASPFDINAVKEGTPLEFKAVDMWELFHDQANTDGVGLDGRTLKVEFYNYYGIKLHRSRVIQLKGIEAPSWLRPRLRGWGLSIVEHLIHSINQYIKSNELVFEVLDEFKLDIFKMKGLRETLLSKEGTRKIQERVQLTNQTKNFQNAIVLDGEDDYATKQLSFAGISEMFADFRIQVASDMRMPLTKLFGLSAQGFSSGEDDIENYNATVESDVRAKCKYQIIRVLEIISQYKFGIVPDDLMITFRPLRILSSEQEQNVKDKKFNRVVLALEKGLCSAEEAKEMINKDDLLPIKVDVTLETLPQGQEPEDKDEKRKNSIEDKGELERFKGPRIVAVGLVSGDELLTGKRRDNGLWTSPGGHMDAGESPEEAACREVMEEAGIQITPEDLELVCAEKFQSHRGGKDFVVFAYIAKVNKLKATAKNDPDKEISKWKWVKISAETPELKPEARHAQRDLIVQHVLCC